MQAGITLSCATCSPAALHCHARCTWATSHDTKRCSHRVARRTSKTNNPISYCQLLEPDLLLPCSGHGISWATQLGTPTAKQAAHFLCLPLLIPICSPQSMPLHAKNPWFLKSQVDAQPMPSATSQRWVISGVIMSRTGGPSHHIHISGQVQQQLAPTTAGVPDTECRTSHREL